MLTEGALGHIGTVDRAEIGGQRIAVIGGGLLVAGDGLLDALLACVGEGVAVLSGGGAQQGLVLQGLQGAVLEELGVGLSGLGGEPHIQAQVLGGGVVDGLLVVGQGGVVGDQAVVGVVADGLLGVVVIEGHVANGILLVAHGGGYGAPLEEVRIPNQQCDDQDSADNADDGVEDLLAAGLLDLFRLAALLLAEAIALTLFFFSGCAHVFQSSRCCSVHISALYRIWTWLSSLKTRSGRREYRYFTERSKYLSPFGQEKSAFIVRR